MKFIVHLCFIFQLVSVIAAGDSPTFDLWKQTYFPGDIRTNQIHSDNPQQRLAARVAQSKQFVAQKNPSQALSLVEEYISPLPENLSWPRILGYVQAAEVNAALARTFDAVRRLEIAREKAEGLGKVAALCALSEILQQQPDLPKALAFEEEALASGMRWFKRQRISDSAGLEPEKPDSDIWKQLIPILESRIAKLKRLVEIDRFGLDYVLYREAQILRRFNHPAALDFTDIPAAFGRKKSSLRPAIGDADFEAARKQYLEIIQLFPEGVYTEASKLYAAVCLAQLGDLRGAMRELTEFYKEKPDGLYRGEALLVMGDLYLVRQWDPVNAKEAYRRAAAWTQSVGEQQRILKTYTVPEKSRKVSQPPESPRTIDEYGQITLRRLEPGFLVNRLTASWYLPRLRAEVEWKLGFLAVVADDDVSAKRHFDSALEYDALLQRAVGQKVYNAYDRLLMSLKHNTFIGREEDLEGVRGKARLAMHWADFHFMLENFELSRDIYQRIQQAALEEKDDASMIRAVAGEILLRIALQEPNLEAETGRLYALALQHPRVPTTPYLLWQCACISQGDPVDSQSIYDLLSRKYPRSRHALEARYNEILRLPWAQHDERRAMTAQFMRDYPTEDAYHAYLAGWEQNVLDFFDKHRRSTGDVEK